jgi:antitoxin component of MazEF toxin-antitoxin module
MMSNLSGLSLSSNSLKGTLPSEVGLLSNLSLLYLWGNSLTGTIPSQIALLSNLADFDLSSNSLTGTIPTEIALMLNLCESSVVWLLVVMIVLPCVFHCTLMLACHFFILQLGCLSSTIV